MPSCTIFDFGVMFADPELRPLKNAFNGEFMPELQLPDEPNDMLETDLCERRPPRHPAAMTAAAVVCAGSSSVVESICTGPITTASGGWICVRGSGAGSTTCSKAHLMAEPTNTTHEVRADWADIKKTIPRRQISSASSVEEAQIVEPRAGLQAEIQCSVGYQE